MRKLTIFLMIIALLFMGATTNVFAAFAAANIGPTTDLDGDVNIPTGKGYYINGTLLAVGDITDALNVTMTNVGATAINAALIPDSEDDTDLGSATYEWANLYIGEAGKIYLRKDQSTSLQATGAGILTITAANGVVLSEGLTVGSAIISDAADTDNLGATDKEWANIYVGTAGKIYLGTDQEVALEVTDANTLAITASSNVDFSGGLDVTAGIIVGANIVSDTADTDDLGSTDAEWANLYIGEAGKIYLRNDQSVDLQATGAGILTLTAANGVVTSHLLTATGGLISGANVSSDTAATDTLGTTDAEWLELYISDGGHVYLDSAQATNIARSGENVITLTASSGVVTSAGLTVTGDLIPAAASTHSLGSTTAEFADLYLDDTGYVYFGIGQDVHIQRTGAGTATFTADTLTASADLTVVGTMAAATVTGEIRLITTDAAPDTTGEIKHDSTVEGYGEGALVWYDGDSVRTVVDLETIAADDDYVVAYDADLDGFYMKADATGASTIKYVDHYMDVHAADADYCHAQMAGTGALQDETTNITSPDVPRNIVVTFGTIGESSGDVTITGTGADGTVDQTEAFTSADATAVIGAKAFATVTKISIPDTILEATTVDIGLDNLLGLSNSIDLEADMYKVTLDGVDDPDAVTGNGNTTNNTLDCGTIAENSDYTIWYTN